jgi:hypothetical protein
LTIHHFPFSINRLPHFFVAQTGHSC